MCFEEALESNYMAGGLFSSVLEHEKGFSTIVECEENGAGLAFYRGLCKKGLRCQNPITSDNKRYRSFCFLD